MKKYSRIIEDLKRKEAKIVEEGEELIFTDFDAIKLIRREAGKEGNWAPDLKPLISSEEFLSKYKGFIDDIAKYKIDINADKNPDGTDRKNFRSLEYASVGVMDKHDIQQEAYLAFMESYNNVNWDKIRAASNPDAMLWGYLKRSTIMNLNIAIRQQKDGIRMPEWYIKEHNVYKGITSLFPTLDEQMSNKAEAPNISKYEQEVLKWAINDLMGKYLDLKKNGSRDEKSIEREVIKNVFGIYEDSMSYKEMAEYFDVAEASLRKVKQRALAKLSNPGFEMEIRDILDQYKITTGSGVDFRTEKVKILENNTEYGSQSEKERPCSIMKGDEIILELDPDNPEDMAKALSNIKEFVKWTESDSYESFRFNQYFNTLDESWLLRPAYYKLNGESVYDSSNEVINTDEASKIKNQLLSKEYGLIDRGYKDKTFKTKGKDVEYRVWESTWGKIYKYKSIDNKGTHPKGDDFLRSIGTMKDTHTSVKIVKLNRHTSNYPLDKELAEGEIWHEGTVEMTKYRNRGQYNSKNAGTIGNNISIGI